MDLIAVDVGNSRISCGLFRGGVLIETWHHETGDPDGAARSIGEKAGGVSIALSSVVPSSSNRLSELLFACGTHFTDVPAAAHKILSGTYQSMGSDRLANAVAAWKLYGKENAAVVLDLGTATTLTAVSPAGQFRGGWITLGLGRTLASLHAQTEQLPAVDLSEPEQVPKLSYDTAEAMTAGTLLAHVGLVEHWVKMSKKTLGQNTVSIATGGWSRLIASQTTVVDFVDECLTLKGIFLVAEQAAGRVDQG